MATREHVAVVKRGTAAIAAWRREHRRERLDLASADLSGADLRGANLKQSYLAFANMTAAKLRGAYLRWADLQWANLTGANLRSTNLMAADLTLTNLSGGDLRRAILVGTFLRESDLRDADLSGTRCAGTAFADCDLSKTRGLESVDHLGPSSIGADTLARTLRGAGGTFTPNQRTFFERAGVAKTLLDYLPSLLESQPIQFFSCFVSHGAPDEGFADRLYEDLREHGLRCWKYDEDALVGRGVWANIDRAIVLHDKAIVVCSESALHRPGVLREIERALQREDDLIRHRAAESDIDIDTDVLVPVRLDDYVLTGWEHPRRADVAAKHIGDFRGWDADEKSYERGLQQLLRALDPRSKLGLSVGPRPSPTV